MLWHLHSERRDRFTKRPSFRIPKEPPRGHGDLPKPQNSIILNKPNETYHPRESELVPIGQPRDKSLPLSCSTTGVRSHTITYTKPKKKIGDSGLPLPHPWLGPRVVLWPSGMLSPQGKHPKAKSFPTRALACRAASEAARHPARVGPERQAPERTAVWRYQATSTKEVAASSP